MHLNREKVSQLNLRNYYGQELDTFFLIIRVKRKGQHTLQGLIFTVDIDCQSIKQDRQKGLYLTGNGTCQKLSGVAEEKREAVSPCFRPGANRGPSAC